MGSNAIETHSHQASCAEVRAELRLLLSAEDSAFLVSRTDCFKSCAATAAELDQKWSGIMLNCFFVLGCTCLGPAVASKTKLHESLPRAGFSEARGSPNRQNTPVKGRQDECNGPKGLNQGHLSCFVLFPLRWISVTNGSHYNEKFSVVPARDLLCPSVLRISLNIARQRLLL